LTPTSAWMKSLPFPPRNRFRRCTFQYTTVHHSIPQYIIVHLCIPQYISHHSLKLHLVRLSIHAWLLQVLQSCLSIVLGRMEFGALSDINSCTLLSPSHSHSYIPTLTVTPSHCHTLTLTPSTTPHACSFAGLISDVPWPAPCLTGSLRAS